MPIPKYIQNYMDAMGIFDPYNIRCEYCWNNGILIKADDIHHVTPRSHFGKKRKDECDSENNLVALCRTCHAAVHDSGKIKKEELLEIIRNR